MGIAYVLIRTTSDFEIEENQNKLADAVAEFYTFLVRLQELSSGLKEGLGKQ